MDNKGAIQISMITIVVVVIAIVLLSLGIVFVRNIIRETNHFTITIYPIEDREFPNDPKIEINEPFFYQIEKRNSTNKIIVQEGYSETKKQIKLEKIKGYYFIWMWTKNHYPIMMTKMDMAILTDVPVELSRRVGNLTFEVSQNNLEENKTIGIKLEAEGKVDYLGFCLKSQDIGNLSFLSSRSYSYPTPIEYINYSMCRDLATSLDNNIITIFFKTKDLGKNPKLDFVLFDMYRFIIQDEYGNYRDEPRPFLYGEDLGVKNIELSFRK